MEKWITIDLSLEDRERIFIIAQSRNIFIYENTRFNNDIKGYPNLSYQWGKIDGLSKLTEETIRSKLQKGYKLLTANEIINLIINETVDNK